MEQWDPMREDYIDKKFNSYSEGVGRDLSGGGHHKKGTCLYVKNIPISLKKEGFYNLFAEYGKVLEAKLINNSNPDQFRGTYGFVTMESMNDAETAIHKLDKKKLGHLTLVVRPALSKEERDRRKRNKQEEENYNSLHNTTLADSNSTLNGVPSPRSFTGQTYSTQVGPSATVDHSAFVPKLEREQKIKICLFCNKDGCIDVCSRCKMYYCSTNCQKKDWPRHREICQPLGVIFNSVLTEMKPKRNENCSQCIKSKVFDFETGKANSSSDSSNRSRYMNESRGATNVQDYSSFQNKNQTSIKGSQMYSMNSAGDMMRMLDDQNSSGKNSSVMRSPGNQNEFGKISPLMRSSDDQNRLGTKSPLMRSPYEQNKSEKKSPSLRNGSSISDGSDVDGPSLMKEETHTSLSVVELSLEPKLYGQCYLANFESPSKFWICLEEYIEFFVDNTNLMKKMIPETYPHKAVVCKVGESFAVLHLGEWSRVTIESVSGSQITVFFVDHGFQAIVRPEDLRPLSKDMVELPAQAVCCSISKVKPKGSETWSQAACTAVQTWLGNPHSSLLKYEVMERKGKVHAVKISCNGVGMSEMLVAEGFAERTEDESALPKLTKESKLLVPATPRLMAHSLPSRMDKMINDETISGVIVDLISAQKFMFLDKGSMNILDNLSLLMQSEYENSMEPYRPIQGELVAAKFSDDEKWYRAEVMNSEGDSNSLFFVDYGNSEDQTAVNIRPVINQNLIDLPKQALICNLDFKCLSDCDLDNVDQELKTLINSLYENEGPFQLHIKEKGKESLLVDLLTRSGFSLTTMLAQSLPKVTRKLQFPVSPTQSVANIQQSPAKSLSDTDHSRVQTPRLSPRTNVINVESLLHNGEPFLALVSHIESCNMLCVTQTDVLPDLMNNLNMSADSLPCIENPVKGSLYAAQYSLDDAWYRVQITEICNPTTCIVYFIDYGNSEKTSLSKLRKLEPAMAKIPGQAICCCLLGYEPYLNQSASQKVTSATNDLVLRMKDELLDKMVTVQVVDRKHNSWIIKMKNEQGECINTKYSPISHEIESAPKLSDLKFKMPAEKDFDVTISYFNNFSDFFCQPHYPKVVAKMESLSNKLKEDANKINGKCHIDPEVGGIYAVKYEGSWCRCVVKKVENSRVFIQHIDYGRSEETLARHLRPLSREALLVPVTLISCKLYGVVPKHENWNSPEVKQYFEILSRRYPTVRLVIEATENDKFLVSLFFAAGGEQTSVADDFVAIGLATRLKIASLAEKIVPILPSHLQIPHTNEEKEEDICEIERKIQELQMQLERRQQKKPK